MDPVDARRCIPERRFPLFVVVAVVAADAAVGLLPKPVMIWINLLA